MHKLKLKIESYKYLLPIIFKTVKFKLKVWWHKKFIKR